MFIDFESGVEANGVRAAKFTIHLATKTGFNYAHFNTYILSPIIAFLNNIRNTSTLFEYDTTSACTRFSFWRLTNVF